MKIPAQFIAFLIAVFQLFCVGSRELAVAQSPVRTHFDATQHHIIFHNVSGEEVPDYTLNFEEGEDSEDDSNEALKNILAASVARRTFFPVTKHQYTPAPGGSFFFEQTPLFVLHGNFRV